MNSSQTKLVATPQFDVGRWKWRLELGPVSADRRANDEHHFNESGSGKKISLSARQQCRQTDWLNFDRVAVPILPNETRTTDSRLLPAVSQDKATGR